MLVFENKEDNQEEIIFELFDLIVRKPIRHVEHDLFLNF